MAGIIKALYIRLPSPPTNHLNTQFPIKKLIPTNSFISVHNNPLIFHLNKPKPKPKPRFIPSTIRAAASFDNVNDGEKKHLGNALRLVQPLLHFAANNFLPLALVGGIALGLANPSLGCFADRCYLSKVSSFYVFLISGLTLRSHEIGAASDAWPVGIFGVVSILLLTPAFSTLILKLNLQPREFVTGLAIFTCMPTGLSCGASFTQIAGGNFPLALAMTVISNILGILIVPFTISKFVAAGVGVSIPAKPLFKSLVVTLLVPLILGKVLREVFDGVAEFVDNNRKLLAIMNSLFISFNPWIQVSKSRSLILMVKPSCFLLAVGLGVLLHVALLSFNAIAMKALSSLSGGKESVFSNAQNAIALLLVASQKTLQFTVVVVDQLSGAMGASGLLVLPCVAAHLNQIILDSFLVNSLLRRDQSVHMEKGA